MNDTSENASPPGEIQKDLLLFQMGPVQEFIAQAATPSDLWAGSYLLSSLILAGIKVVPNYLESLVFPNLKDGTVLDAMKPEKCIPTIPNRFLAFVPKDEGANVALRVNEAIRGKLDELVTKGDLPPGSKVQADQFLQTFWAVLENPSSDMGKNYADIGKCLATRRSVREFEPWAEDPATRKDGRNGSKDFLSGKETALADGRGAMNLLKTRLSASMKKDKIKIQTKDDKYLAVFAMDGDKMGATLSGLATEEDHRRFSKRLAEFAMSAERMMPENGVLLYAGGDDVLAVVPAKTAIDTARNIAYAFSVTMKDFTWKDEEGKEHPVSASAGIAVGHTETPLLDLVHAAQDAEHRAKNDYGRNALALAVLKRSGEMLHWGCNWDSAALGLHSEIVDSLKDDLSARFPYKLASFLAPYELGEDTKPDMEPVVMKELEHVWERSSKKESLVHEKAEAYLHEAFGRRRPQDFLALFLCETFINRQRAEEN